MTITEQLVRAVRAHEQGLWDAQQRARHTDKAWQANAAAADRFRAETSGSTAKVFLYAPIGGWFGVLAEDFVREVNALEVDEIHLHVNSPGGAAFDGLAMANVLRNHPAKVTAHVDGLAASAASMVILGADDIVMEPGSQLMIHEAWGYASGDSQDMAKTAEVLDKLSQNYATQYAAKAGGTADEWRAAMREESWYTADEAVEAGLADRVAGAAAADDSGPGAADDGADDGAAASAAAKAAARWDLSMFSHDPNTAPNTRTKAAAAASLTPGASAPGSTPSAASASGDTHDEGSTMDFNESQIGALCNAVGVGVDSDADTIVAAVQEALSERADGPTAQDTSHDDGTVVRVDRAQFEQLQSDAAAGRQALTAQETAARAQLVDDAVRQGRIAPESRAKWLTRLETDPDDAQRLAALEPVFNTVERGHAGDTGLDSDAQLATAVGWGDDEEASR